MRSGSLALASAIALTLSLGITPALALVTNSSSPGAAISPDNGCLDDTNNGTGLGGITDTIEFTESGTISDVDVAVEITHTWRSDIQMVLSYSGGGGTVRLANAHGNSANSDNYFATFDSDSGLLCSDTSACNSNTVGGGVCQTAPGATCAPDQSLDAFDALTAPGTFTLAICDRASQDLGTLNSWSITLDGSGDLPVELSGFSIE